MAPLVAPRVHPQARHHWRPHAFIVVADMQALQDVNAITEGSDTDSVASSTTAASLSTVRSTAKTGSKAFHGGEAALVQPVNVNLKHHALDPLNMETAQTGSPTPPHLHRTLTVDASHVKSSRDDLA